MSCPVITVTDMIGREVTVTPGSYERVVCIGAGALRMYSYIGDAVGYSYDHAQRFFDDDFMVDYLNLEYYTEPLPGPERLLYAYSQFVKEKIDAYE